MSKEALLFEKSGARPAGRKNFCYMGRALRQRARPMTKVFWFFFSKKNCFPCFFDVFHAPRRYS
jgi:hypothetical protein